MAAGTTIQHKRKAGAFVGGDLAAGEIGVDTTNGVVYFSTNGSTVTMAGGGDYIGALQSDIAEMAFDLAILQNVGIYEMANGVAITYDDATGFDAGASSNYRHDTANERVYNQTLDTAVKLQLGFEGSDGSTTFTDASTNSFVPTRVGSPVISTAQYKYGASSLNLTASGDRLTYADHADLKMGTGDFTVQFWARITTVASDCTFFEKGINISGGLGLLRIGSNLRFYVGSTFGDATAGMSNGTWHHIAITRSGTTARLFRDGTELTSMTATQNLNATSLLMIGGVSERSSPVGWIDDFRITKGTALYTAGFTPPTELQPPGSAPLSMTLVSAAYAAASAPADVAFTMRFVEPDSDVTLNTDLIVEISRDGGTTWSAMTLTELRTAGTTVVASGTVDVSAQPSGSSLKSRITTPGGTPKAVEIVAHTLQIN
jgi:hypothetical protein